MPSPPTDARSRGAALALAVLGGALLASGAPPLSSRAGPFLGLSLLCAAQRERAAARPLFAGLVGLAFGSTIHAVGLFWIARVFQHYGGLTPGFAWACAPLLWLLQGLPYALACFATSVCMQRSRHAPVFLPLTVTTACWLTPQIFPFQPGALGTSWLWLAQVAELSGASLVTLCMVGTASACHVLFRVRSFAPGPLLALVLLFVLPQAYGALRIGQVGAERAEAESMRVAVIQPNVSMESLSQLEGQERALQSLRELTRELWHEHVDLTVWPESAYPFRLARARTREPLDRERAITLGDSGPVLFGALTYGQQGSEEREYNSAWLAQGDGTLGARVDKKHLLPFAEFIPFWHTLPFARERFHSPGLSAGTSGVIPIKGRRLGVLICYEDLIASLSRKHAQARGHALVNLTNDGWFGRTSIPLIHDALARLRSIETRRDLLRATNTGKSSLTSATGEVVAEAQPFVRTGFVAELSLLSGRTLYTRLGDWVAPLCLLGCFGLWLDARRFR